LIAGVNNGLYHYSGGKLEFISVPPISLGIDFNEKEIKEHKLTVKKGDSLFLFTDGLADQFGMENGKKVKYNIKRLEKTFTGLATSPDLKSAEAQLEKTMNSWKGELDQLDDVCVVGVRL
jgi:serine phosphatase RsbU (regulator of sigma subunit)